MLKRKIGLYAACLLITAAFQVNFTPATKSIEDPLKTSILKSGMNDSLCNEYRKYIINTKINFAAEEKFIGTLNDGIYKTFLHSLLLKKRMKHKEMYDLLLPLLREKSSFLPLYNELVFSAAASGRLSELESKAVKAYSSGKDALIKDYIYGLINVHKGEYTAAAEYFKRVTSVNSSGEILLQYSSLYRNLGDYEKAYEILRSGKESLQKDCWWSAGSLMAEGSLYYLSGKYKDAEALYKKGYETALKNNLNEVLVKILVNLGIIEDQRGNTAEAREKFFEAASLAENINDYEGEASAYSELGVSYSYLNNLPEAKKNYLKSFELYKKLGNNVRLSLLSQNLGRIYQGLFSYQKALAYFMEGLMYAGENKRARVLNMIGAADCYSNLSNYSKALKYYKEAEETASSIKELELSAEVDYGLGILNYSLENFPAALKYFKLSGKDSDPNLTADILHKTGISYFKLDSLRKSEKYLNEALQLAGKNSDQYTEAQCLLDLSYIFLNKKDDAGAKKLLQRAGFIALENDFRHIYANVLLAEGKIDGSKNNFSEAQKKFRESLKIGMQLPEYELILESTLNLAELFEKNNLEEAAESYYRSALKTVDEISEHLFSNPEIQISYFSGKREINEKYAQFLLKKNRVEEAFELIENSRSRNTMRNLRSIKLQSLVRDNDLLEKLYESEWAISSGIYNAHSLDSLKAVNTFLKEELTAKYPGSAKYIGSPAKYSIKKIQNELNNEENIISIYSDDSSTFLFLLSKETFIHFRIDAGKDKIKSMVSSISPYFGRNFSQSRLFYNHDLFAFNTEAAYNLYAGILKPALDKIPAGEKIIISPSTELIPVPLEFLVTRYNPEESLYDYSSKDYLIYKYDISYIPSSGIYIEQKNNNLRNNDMILVAGNPALSSAKGFDEMRGILEEIKGAPRNLLLMPLRYSGDEIEQVSSLLNADQVLTENEATESRFKSSAVMSKLIHLSTHSFLFNKQPLILFSGSPDAENDGLLEAGEIVEMKLNSDLVVLSSCNSGLGEIDPSEGILGMTKAFFEAGAKSVVVSLWDVNDKYTSKFMGLFYERLREGRDKSKALRMAKIDFIKQYSPNPYFWAAFVLSGNTSSVQLNSSPDIFPFFLGLTLIIALALLVINIRKKNKLLNTP